MLLVDMEELSYQEAAGRIENPDRDGALTRIARARAVAASPFGGDADEPALINARSKEPCDDAPV